MGQLRVGHSVYWIEGQGLEDPLFLCQNGVSMSNGWLSNIEHGILNNEVELVRNIAPYMLVVRCSLFVVHSSLFSVRCSPEGKHTQTDKIIIDARRTDKETNLRFALPSGVGADAGLEAL